MTDERRGPDRVHKPSVLVVDDSTTIRRILAGHLRDAGYDVVEAEDGQAGLAACRERLPDLMLLDVDMPVLDGRATLAAMKADPDLAGVPVLFLTAHAGGEDVAAGLEMGAQDYLRKPCEPAELLARVRTALRMDQMQKLLTEQAAALDELSNTDPLTGLGNRRRFEQTLPGLAVGDTSESIGFLILDIDHFKQVNDVHGHAVGDVVLRILAERLRHLAPPEVDPFRWGGEEFVVLAPGLGASDLAARAEEIRQGISVPQFRVDADRLLQVTVSIGGVSAPAARWQEALLVADAALYEAKASGRNVVRIGQLVYDPGSH